MSPDQLALLTFVVGGVVLFGGILAMFAKFFRQVPQGQALIVTQVRGEPAVTFTGAVVVPIINRAEFIDISVKTIEIDRRGKEGLICKDNIRADIKVRFFVRVNKTGDDVLKVAQSLGSARASDQHTIEQLFAAKFSEALKTVGKRLDFEQLYQERESFREQIKEIIGRDLNGFVLDDAAIDFLEQTPLEMMDPQNILDSQGIRKITEITAMQNVSTNELRQKERKDIGSQNLSADEAMFQFEQRRSEAEAKKNKEVEISRARESNEALRIASEEQKKTVLLQTKYQEEMLIAEEARARGHAIAQKNREREVAVETERVEKARQLEQISRTREVELGTIAKEKEVEVQRREIADVVRGRVAVDKTVAEEEERIKDVRVLSESKRSKDAAVIAAQASAEQEAVRQVRSAEASEQAARLDAKTRIVRAEAEFEASDKTARAKMRLAEGDQAEAAAAGLAEAKVMEARATALEKQGLAEALVIREKQIADAVGSEKRGLAEANVIKERLLAEAVGTEQRGLADARVKETAAAAIERQGLAEASVTREKLVAEATGIAQKAEAMKALDGVGRDHEEYKLRLEKERAVALASIDVQKDVAHAQASVMGKAMESAKIQIVGGDGKFFDQFVRAVTLGKSIDGAVDGSDTLKTALREYLQEGRSLPEDVRSVLANPALDAEALRDMSASALLAKLAAQADGPLKQKLERLQKAARELDAK